MKSHEELCLIFQRIAKDPLETVDYLTVSDYLQMRQHIQICEECDELTNQVVEEGKDVDVNFGGASEN